MAHAHQCHMYSAVLLPTRRSVRFPSFFLHANIASMTDQTHQITEISPTEFSITRALQVAIDKRKQRALSNNIPVSCAAAN